MGHFPSPIAGNSRGRGVDKRGGGGRGNNEAARRLICSSATRLVLPDYARKSSLYLPLNPATPTYAPRIVARKPNAIVASGASREQQRPLSAREYQRQQRRDAVLSSGALRERPHTLSLSLAPSWQRTALSAILKMSLKERIANLTKRERERKPRGFCVSVARGGGGRDRRWRNLGADDPPDLEDGALPGTGSFLPRCGGLGPRSTDRWFLECSLLTLILIRIF